MTKARTKRRVLDPARRFLGVASVLCLVAACGESRVRAPGPPAAAASSAKAPGPDAARRPSEATARPAAEAPTPGEHEEAGSATADAVARWPGIPEAAAELHRRALVFDAHNDVTLRIVDDEGFDLGVRQADGHTDLVRMREGGLDAEILIVWVNPKRYQGEAAWHRATTMLEGIHEAVKAHPDKARIALTAAEVRSAEADGKVAIVIGVEGAHALGDFADEERVLDRIRWLHSKGVRSFTLSWMNSNQIAGSSGDAGRERGLSKLGRRAVALMNELGMMVDLSHVSDSATFDGIEASRLPVLVSHSATRAKANHYRNVTDEMLRAVAKNGGAVCINFYSGFIDMEWRAARLEARRTKTELKRPPPPLGVLLDHVDHAVKVAGPDHVCLGSDFDGCGSLPAGLEDVTKMPALTAGLLERGYSREDVLKIVGGNILRVMEANQRGASGTPGPSSE